MTTYEGVRSALQHKHEELRQRLGKIQRNLRATPALDSEEQAIEQTDLAPGAGCGTASAQ